MKRTVTGTTGQARQDLARMRQRLDDWRRGHARRVAFPEKLWSAAGRLAQRHGIYVTARALGLEYNKLKRFSGAVAQPGDRSKRPAVSVQTAVKFIELTGALPVSTSGCRLSLQRTQADRDCNWRWRRARRPRWYCSCAGRVGRHPRSLEVRDAPVCFPTTFLSAVTATPRAPEILSASRQATPIAVVLI
jgi:hypothetical protein